MAITSVTPAAASVIENGDSFEFTVDDTYTSMVIQAQSATSLESVYNSATTGAQAGYTVTLVDNGSTHTFTVARDAGWDVSPQLIYVTEDETGASAQTSISYTLAEEQAYPQGQTPYNATAGAGSINYVRAEGITAQDAALFTERADHVNTPPGYTGGTAELWIRDGSNQAFIFTDDRGNDFIQLGHSDTFPPENGAIPVLHPSLGVQGMVLSYDTFVYSNGRLEILYTGGGEVLMKEQASMGILSAGTGMFWVRDDAPNVPMFTNDANDDALLAPSTGHVAAPGAGDNEAAGYPVGTFWVDETNDDAYISVDGSTTAVWKKITP